MSSCSGSLNNVTLISPVATRGVGQCGWELSSFRVGQDWGERSKGTERRGPGPPRWSNQIPRMQNLGLHRLTVSTHLWGQDQKRTDRENVYLTKTWLGCRFLSTGPEGLPRPEAQR